MANLIIIVSGLLGGAVARFLFKKFDQIKHIENLEKITKTLFSNKRKMINKTMKKIFDIDQLNLIKNLNFKSRPSELKPEKYYEITKIFENL